MVLDTLVSLPNLRALIRYLTYTFIDCIIPKNTLFYESETSFRHPAASCRSTN